MKRASIFIAMAAVMMVAVAGSIAAARGPVAASHPTLAPVIAKNFHPVHLSADDLATGKSFVTSIDSLGKAIVYHHNGDLWLYNMTTHRSARLTTDGDKVQEWDVAVRDAKTLTYRQDNKVIALDLETARASVVASVSDELQAYGWSTDGTVIAMLSHKLNKKTGAYSPVLRIKNLLGGTSHRVTLPGVVPDGECGIDDHQIRVTFSPDGSMILVEDTVLQEGSKTVFVAGRDGSMIIKPMYAVYARWIPGTSKVIARGYESRHWFTMDATTALSERVHLPDDAANAELSPDGSKIAFTSDQLSHPRLTIYDVATGSMKKLATDYFRPRWLSEQAIVATASAPCDCGLPYDEADTGTKLFELAGATEPMPLDTTMDSAVVFRT